MYNEFQHSGQEPNFENLCKSIGFTPSSYDNPVSYKEANV